MEQAKEVASLTLQAARISLIMRFRATTTKHHIFMTRRGYFFFCYGHHVLSRLAWAKASAWVHCLMLNLDHEIINKLFMEAILVDACYASKEH